MYVAVLGTMSLFKLIGKNIVFWFCFSPPSSCLIFPIHSTSLQPISLFLQWGDHLLLGELQSHWDNGLNEMRCEEALKNVTIPCKLNIKSLFLQNGKHTI